MNTVHETISYVAGKATYAGSAGSLIGWLNSSEFGMWSGIVIGIAGLGVNWYFKRKSDRRNQEAHDRYMDTLVLASKTPTIPVEEQ